MGTALRIGVIGTGFGARVVAPVFASTDGCAVVDVVSARDGTAVDELCARGLDLVSVHSPPFLHAPHVTRALDAGSAVLCDKPFGRDASEADAMHRAAEAAGVVHLVNFEFRHDPTRAHVRALVRDGAIGRPEHVQWTHLTAGSRVPLRRHGWLFERAAGGGWIGAWGSHAVDALRWIFGEVESAWGRGTIVVRERPDADGRLHPVDAEDGFAAWLTVGDGVTVAVDSTFASPVSLAPRLVIVGSEGVLECVADSFVTVRAGDGSRREIRRPRDGDAHLEPMRRWAEVVRDAVRDGAAPPGAPTFADGVACARVLDALRSGSGSGAAT